MSIPKNLTERFDNLVNHARNNSLCLLECTDIKSGEPRYVLCGTHEHEDGVHVFPIAQLCTEEDPSKSYLPPEGTEPVNG